jgi:hypothetical protein
VGVLLGNGDGTLRPVVTYDSGGTGAASIAVADVNGDGKPDLVVANGFDNLVGVLLGNGDGTFQPAVSYDTGGEGVGSAAVADVNGDGKLDIVVANFENFSDTGIVGVLLGNGDGTFQPVIAYGGAGLQGATWVAVADLNGDGKPDIAVAYQCEPNCYSSAAVGVLLGNGDGTFQPAVIYPSGGIFSYSIAAADVNGDGKPDLVVTNANSLPCTISGGCAPGGSVGVLLGNGDGTFQAAVAYDSGGDYASSVAVADLNGDGKPDLLVANNNSGTIGLLLGNGDGTFQTAVPYDSGYPGPDSVAVADLTGFGRPGLVAGGRNPGMVSVLLNAKTTATTLVSSLSFSAFGQPLTFTASVTSSAGAPPNREIVSFEQGTIVLGTGTLTRGSAGFITSSLTVGTDSITAVYTGDSNFAPSNSAIVKQVVRKASTTITLASSENPSSYGQSVTFTATVTPQFSGTPTGSIKFYNGAAILGTATLSSGVASHTTTKLAVGTHSITAHYEGSSSFATSTPAAVSQVVNQASTTTTLVSSLNPSNSGQSVTFTATVVGQSGGKVTGSVTFMDGTTTLKTVDLSEGVAKCTTSKLTEGTHTIAATYNGAKDFTGSSASLTQTVN